MLILRRASASQGQLLLHPELLLHLESPDHLCLNLKPVLLLTPYGRLQRQFMMFSMDKKSNFNKLRIVYNVLSMPRSSWSRFSLTELCGKCQGGSSSRAQAGVSRVMAPPSEASSARTPRR